MAFLKNIFKKEKNKEVKVLQENKNNDTEKRLGEIEEAINTQIAPTKVDRKSVV